MPRFKIKTSLAVVAAVTAAATFRYKTIYQTCDSSSKAVWCNTFDAVCDSNGVIDDNRLYDVAIVGGGIVGVATARELQKRFPTKKIILLEKEATVAQHQSGHNSGVIHAGIYNAPGTAMAGHCVRGAKLMYEYCGANRLPHQRVGKLVVATDVSEIKAVESLYETGVKNGVEGLKILRGREEIKKLEPNVEGIAALYSPNTGIADYAAVTRHMFKELCKAPTFSSKFLFTVQDASLVKIEWTPSNTEAFVLLRGRESRQTGPIKSILARHVIACCGLHNDAFSHISGPVTTTAALTASQSLSFRGRYYQMKPSGPQLVRMNIYPTPRGGGIPVGIHFTPTVDEIRGSRMIIGPGSAACTAPEGYNPFQFDIEYCFCALFNQAIWMFLYNNGRCLSDQILADFSRQEFLRQARLMVPSLKDADVEESFAGVMAAALSHDGALQKDLITELKRPVLRANARVVDKKLLDVGLKNEEPTEKSKPLILNVRNAPSPAATASMAIAESIVDQAKNAFYA